MFVSGLMVLLGVMMNNCATFVVQIGNSDNRLTIQRWADFIRAIDKAIIGCGVEIHFRGGSVFVAPWLNACWVFEMDESLLSKFITKSYS